MNHFLTDTTLKNIPINNGMIVQPAALALHFFFEKDERQLRAREVSLDSLAYSPQGGEYAY
ncbi:hypothetical protein [Photobacterium leiognathi]|uniref:hypothetical protein n=1 Tax=Photobacterium leiognathi TaxID=553611 RepID=UPI00298155FC|nr:hypothetical protein [Photobacterium leiognathi]